MGEDKKGNQYAIKTLSKDFLRRTQKVGSVFRERDILYKNKTCLYLPRIFHTFSDEEYLYIAMEYVNNGTLTDKINYNPVPGFTKEVSQFYAAQIVVTLEYLKSQNIAHRDLKPGNIMIDEFEYVKIIDFGEAKIVDAYEDEENFKRFGQDNSSDGDSSFFGRLKPGKKEKEKKKERSGSFVGTALYVAPEMLEANQSSFYTDLWALGCIVYEMVTGQKMWAEKNNGLIFDRILKNDVSFPSFLDIETIDLIK